MRRSARAELVSAGITDPALQAAYKHCRALFAGHGRTYFLATLLLPAARRPAVHALYAFARYADEIVDAVDGPSLHDRAAAIDALRHDLDAALAGVPGRSACSTRHDLDKALAGKGGTHPVLTALADTATRYGIAHAHFTDFLTAMRMDTEVSVYATLADLGHYMHGSAAVIGLQMLPVLGTVGPRAEAEPAAAALGVAFQLTNFLRDVGEDLDRGRVYLPTAELAAFGVDRDLLLHCRRTGRTTPRVQAALAALAAHTRGVYRDAEPGIDLLEPVSRECVRCAFRLYRRILDELAAAGYPLDRRVVVPRHHRAAVAGPGLLRALAARR